MLIGVVAHEGRFEMASKLIDDVYADAVHWDDGTRGCEDSHIEVLRQLAIQNRHKHHDWLVVFEDDATPINGFRLVAERSLQKVGTRVVSFFMQTGNLENPMQQEFSRVTSEAKLASASWITAEFLCSGVAYAVHRSVVEDLVHYLQHCRKVELPLRITYWARRNKIPVWYTFPSLVDHADVQSVIAPEAIIPPRKAWFFGKESPTNDLTIPVRGHYPPWTGLSEPQK